MADDKPKFKFQIYKRSDFGKAPGMVWAVESLLPRRGSTVFYGEPKSGKSFIFHSMACAATAEWPNEEQRLWCGFPILKMKILFIAAEGFEGLMGRHDAWEIGHKVRISDDLQYMRRPINYFASDADIKQALKDLKDQGFCPDYVFVDTLSRSMLGGNERDEGHMTRVFTHAEMFCQELNNAGMGFTHHAKKDGTGFRGSGAIFAMVDALEECKSALEQGQTRTTLICEAFKDAKPFAPVTVEYGVSTVETEEGLQEIPYVKGTTAGPKDEKQNKDMELMLMVFRMMGCRATRTDWANQMRNFTREKKGDGWKEGWSDDTFDRRMKIFKTFYPVRGGGIKGDPYVLVENDPPVDRPQNHPHRNPYIGIAGNAGDYGQPQSPADYPQAGFAGDATPGCYPAKMPPALAAVPEDEAIAIMFETAAKQFDEKSRVMTPEETQAERDKDYLR
jgi:hypothetical protein